jgi:type IX secretion system PorP/SprF family membrane protein
MFVRRPNFCVNIMFKKLIFSFFVLLFLVISNNVSAQDVHFSQFYSNRLYLIPAYAGSVRCPRLVTNYRNQWPSLSGNYVTYAASYDRHVDDLNGGIGVMVMADRMGDNSIGTNSLSGFYSYQIGISRSVSVRAGLQISFNQMSIDPTKFSFNDQIDPRYGFVKKTNEKIDVRQKSYADFSAGGLVFSKIFYGGIAVSHITQPDQSFIKNNSSPLPMKFTVNAGAKLKLGDDETSLSPNVIFQQQATFQTLNIGLYFTKGPFISGLWYRNQDALISLVGLQLNGFRFGYSYDITTSKLNKSQGSHEISASYRWYCKPKRKVFTTTNCPEF